MKNLTDDIKKNSITHGSIPFWSWNDKLQENELRKQIRNMHELNMNGFFMHARCGLETEYLSKEWFDATKVCIDEAKKLGMEAWAYDENGWPSGFAGGKLLLDPDNHAVYLKHKFSDNFPENADEIYAIYALKGKNKPILTKVPVECSDRYLLVYYCTDSSYVDTMRQDITDKFIEQTHQLYKDKLGDDYGKAMPGFFTDEPQYYRYAPPFSKYMDKWFKEEYGYSVFDAIPAIFVDFEGYQSYLYDYHKMTHSKFMSGFAKRVYDWAEKNGIQITGHAIEENSLGGQMLACGSIMPFYEYEHIPGIDYLGRAHSTPLASKQLGSVCEQLGKKKALSEMFACCGWDISPSELKGIAELQYAGGVNLMCQHLYPYSERGQRKRDYPAHYSAHSTWQDKMKDFNDYFNNLGYLLSLGRQHADILVIHPIHTAWLTYRRHIGASTISQVENDTTSLVTKLSAHQLPYHFGEEMMMVRYAKNDADKIKVGKCSYGTVIIPKIDTIDDNTVTLLRNFANNGGKLYAHKSHLPIYIDGKPDKNGDLDFLQNALDLDDPAVFERICAENDYMLRADGLCLKNIRSMIRDTDNYGRIYYLTNIEKDTVTDAVFTVKGNVKLASLDMLTLKQTPLRGRFNGDKTEILLNFEPNQSHVLVQTEDDYLPFETTKEIEYIKLVNDFELKNFPENAITLDCAAISFNGVDFTEMRPIERIRDNLLYERYKGEIWLRYEFNTDFIPENIAFVCEKPNVIDICVNGQPMSLGKKSWFDNFFAKTNILPFVITGKNEVTVHMSYFQNDYVYHVLYGNVMESLRNCLNFDTEIEAAYIVGDFAVKTVKTAFTPCPDYAERYEKSAGFTLTAQNNRIDPTDLVKEGYPFFSGKIELQTDYNYTTGQPTILRLDGRYTVCDVFVNGEKAGVLMFNNTLDLSEHLREGENKITLVLCTNRRNLLGPHHLKTAEPMGVSPNSFSFEGGWNGSECPAFVEDYNFVRFGINLI